MTAGKSNLILVPENEVRQPDPAKSNHPANKNQTATASTTALSTNRSANEISPTDASAVTSNKSRHNGSRESTESLLSSAGRSSNYSSSDDNSSSSSSSGVSNTTLTFTTAACNGSSSMRVQVEFASTILENGTYFKIWAGAIYRRCHRFSNKH